MAFLDDLQKQADSLGELAKQITDHRNQYKAAGTLCHKSNDHFKTEFTFELTGRIKLTPRWKKKV